MAKKKAKRAAPTRACEGCGTAYHPRSAKCPKCEKPNPTLHGGGKRKKSSNGRRKAAPAGDDLEAAIKLVESAGSMAAAQAALDTISHIKSL